MLKSIDSNNILEISNNNNLCSRLNNLLINEKYTDCVFDVDKQLIKCHKIILTSASPVFEAMFYGPLSDKTNKIILITDINYDIFKLMLNFIYTDFLNLNNVDIDNLIELYLCADKYIINNLIYLCVNNFQRKLYFNNVLRVLDVLFYINIKPLLKITKNYFLLHYLLNNNNNNYEIISLLNNYYHINMDCLNYILINNNNNDLDITNNVYKISIICLINKWLITECKLKNIDMNDSNNIKLLLNNININKELNNFLYNNYNNILVNDNKHLNIDKTNYPLITCHRTYFKATRPLIINNLKDGNYFETSFSVNQSILLQTIIVNSCYKNINNKHNYIENFFLEMYNSNKQVIYRKKYFIFNVNYNTTFDINLDNCLTIKADKIYHIKIIWDDYSYKNEYPCNIYSNIKITNSSSISFNDNNVMMNGSIIVGFKYKIVQIMQ